jgi:hypothetical protein
MRTTKEATERSIRLAELHLVQQQARIERQRQLIWSLEADGHVDLARDARQLLTEMTALLGRMQNELTQAEARLIGREAR